MDALTRDLSVLAEPVRIRLLAALDPQELGVGELCRVVQLPQSTVSRHLKALQVAGWIRRRSEGTSGLFRVDREAVDPVGIRLWDVVRDAYRATRQAEEDQLRLEAVLASRSEDGSFFGRRPGEWDALRRELFGDTFLTSAIAALLPPSWTVADLGCGTGPALIELAGAVRRVVGIDREPRMVELARARTADLPNVEIRLGGLEGLPLEDGEVDAAICLLVLHHVDDPTDAFREASRVLVPGGSLVVVDMVAHDREDWRHLMGHRHLGFGQDALIRWASAGGLALRSFRLLPPGPEAQGPPLFLAVFAAGPTRRPRPDGLPTP
ncbi:MAG: metalloregulator ArsR/SmtB family transcription factor [Myxococcota bacterium]